MNFLQKFKNKKNTKTELEIEKEQAQQTLNSLSEKSVELNTVKKEYEIKASSITFRINNFNYDISGFKEEAQGYVSKQDEKSARNILQKVKILKEQISNLNTLKEDYDNKIKEIEKAIASNEKDIFDISSVLDKLNFMENMEKDSLIGNDSSSIRKLLNRNNEESKTVKELTESLKIRVEARQIAKKTIDDIHAEDSDFSGNIESFEEYEEKDPEIEAMLEQMKLKK